MIDRQYNWEAYVRLQGEMRTTVYQRGDEIGGWVSGKDIDREPLEEEAARDLYEVHLTKARQAIEDGTAQFTYQEPFLQGQIFGYSFKMK